MDASAYIAMIDAGNQYFTFSGYRNSFSGSDESRFVVEYLDSGTVVLDSFDTGFISPSAWLLSQDNRLASVGTRTIRIRLIARRNAGGNNDGYFDGLQLLACG